MRLVAALAIAALSFLPPACAAQPKASVAAEAPASGDWGVATKGLKQSEGFLDLYVDAKGGRVLAAFPAPDGDGLSLRAIHSAGLTAGLGSNPIGLNRGYFDEGGILAFRRVGKKLVAEKENWTYRASADNPLERKAVRESFARSFLWSGDIIAEGADGALLVDLSGFLTRDALDVRGALQANEEGGSFAIAEDRTMPDTGAAFAFPDNVEFDAFLTLTSDEPKSQVRATAADARAFTLVQHQSLVRLPDDIDDVLVAGMMVRGLTARILLTDVFPVREGSVILVQAAAGGVGQLLCQWARHLGATVIGTVGSQDKAERARRHGCHHVILYREQNVVDTVKQLTDGRGVDVAYDSVGKDTFYDSLACLAPRGHLVNFGQSSGPVEPLAMPRLAAGSFTVVRPMLGHYTADPADRDAAADAFFQALRDGILTPDDPVRYALQDVGQAHDDMEARRTHGAVVLMP